MKNKVAFQTKVYVCDQHDDFLHITMAQFLLLFAGSLFRNVVLRMNEISCLFSISHESPCAMSELLLKYDDDDVNDNDDLKHFNKYNNFRVI